MRKIEKYITEARSRAQRRKSLWNVLLFVFAFLSIGFITFYSSKYIIYLFQPDTTPFSAIGQKNDIQLIFIIVPLFLVSIPWGLMLGNILIWLIPPARRTLDREAQGYKGCSFNESMRGLCKIASIMSVIFIPIAIFASSKIKL